MVKTQLLLIFDSVLPNICFTSNTTTHISATGHLKVKTEAPGPCADTNPCFIQCPRTAMVFHKNPKTNIDGWTQCAGCHEKFEGKLF